MIKKTGLVCSLIFLPVIHALAEWKTHEGVANQVMVDEWTYYNTSVSANLEYANGIASNLVVTNQYLDHSIFISGLTTGTDQYNSDKGTRGEEILPKQTKRFPLGYQNPKNPIRRLHFTYQYWDGPSPSKGGPSDRNYPTGNSTSGDRVSHDPTGPLGTGDVQLTLTWQEQVDLDLHVIDPSGEEIYYSHNRSKSGGVLDVDDTHGPGPENIFWPSGGAPKGTYLFFVRLFSGEGPAHWTIRLQYGATTKSFSGTVLRKGTDTDTWKFYLGESRAAFGYNFNPSTKRLEPANDTLPFTPNRFEFNPDTRRLELVR